MWNSSDVNLSDSFVLKVVITEQVVDILIHQPPHVLGNYD